MLAWHRSRRADFGLRALGLVFCGISYAAMTRLVAMHIPPHAAGIAAYSLAAVGFIAASGGSALLFLGHHLFDEVEVSARWRGRPISDLIFTSESEFMKNTREATMLVVGHDVDDSWTVRESGGMLLGRFASAQAAQRFAQAERRTNSAVTIATSAGVPHRIEGRLTLASARVASGTTRG